MSLVQNNAQQDLTIKAVSFNNNTGASVTLREGDALAYDMDDTNAPAAPTADFKNARGRRVVTPATAVLGGFAGLVAPQSAGKVIANGDSAFIDIIVPRKGDICKGYTNVNCTKGSSALGITNAGGRILVAFTDATLNLDFVAVAMETVDRSGTNGTVLVRFV